MSQAPGSTAPAAMMRWAIGKAVAVQELGSRGQNSVGCLPSFVELASAEQSLAKLEATLKRAQTVAKEIEVAVNDMEVLVSSSPIDGAAVASKARRAAAAAVIVENAVRAGSDSLNGSQCALELRAVSDLLRAYTEATSLPVATWRRSFQSTVGPTELQASAALWIEAAAEATRSRAEADQLQASVSSFLGVDAVSTLQCKVAEAEQLAWKAEHVAWQFVTKRGSDLALEIASELRWLKCKAHAAASQAKHLAEHVDSHDSLEKTLLSFLSASSSMDATPIHLEGEGRQLLIWPGGSFKLTQQRHLTSHSQLSEYCTDSCENFMGAWETRRGTVESLGEGKLLFRETTTRALQKLTCGEENVPEHVEHEDLEGTDDLDDWQMILTGCVTGSKVILTTSELHWIRDSY